MTPNFMVKDRDMDQLSLDPNPYAGTGMKTLSRTLSSYVDCVLRDFCRLLWMVMLNLMLDTEVLFRATILEIFPWPHGCDLRLLGIKAEFDFLLGKFSEEF